MLCVHSNVKCDWTLRLEVVLSSHCVSQRQHSQPRERFVWVFHLLLFVSDQNRYCPSQGYWRFNWCGKIDQCRYPCQDLCGRNYASQQPNLVFNLVGALCQSFAAQRCWWEWAGEQSSVFQFCLLLTTDWCARQVKCLSCLMCTQYFGACERHSCLCLMPC